jgi:hypothetical protein
VFRSDSVADVDYHRLNCTGVWRLAAPVGERNWVFEESITPGVHSCVRRGQVRLSQRADGGLDYAWEGGAARATLRRGQRPVSAAPTSPAPLQEGVYHERRLGGTRPMGNKVLWEVNCHGSVRLGCDTLLGGPFVLFNPSSPHRARFDALAERLANCTLWCPGEFEVEERNYSLTMVSPTHMIIRTVALTRDRYGDELRNIGAVVLDVRATGADPRMPWQIWNVLEAPGMRSG